LNTLILRPYILYRAHRAVIFAIVGLSCLEWLRVKRCSVMNVCIDSHSFHLLIQIQLQWDNCWKRRGQKMFLSKAVVKVSDLSSSDFSYFMTCFVHIVDCYVICCCREKRF